MSKWDQRFLDMAKLVASWSKDPSTQVGAVIVDADNRIVSTGFNGFARKVADDTVNRDIKLLRTIHAEDNALLFARRDVSGMTIYVTHPPCARCAAKIIQSGISKVLYPYPGVTFLARWHDDIDQANSMFREANVQALFIR